MSSQQQETLEEWWHKEITQEPEQAQPQPFSPLVGCGNGYGHPFQLRTAKYNYHQELQATMKQVYAQFPRQQWYLIW